MGAQDMVVAEVSAHTMWHVEQFSCAGVRERHFSACGTFSHRVIAALRTALSARRGRGATISSSVIAAGAGAAELTATGCRRGLHLGCWCGGLQRERGADFRGIVEWSELDRGEDETVRAIAERA
jgi:hypothetical protein